MKQISIIFPNQLFEISPILEFNCEIIMLEDSLFWGNDKKYKYTNHINKIIFLRSAMYSYRKYLEKSGFKVIYGSNEKNFDTSDYLSKYRVENYDIVNIIEPHDYLILRRLNNFFNKNDIKVNILNSPMFLINDSLKNKFEANNKKPLMARFYENQRKDLKILVDSNGSPTGGKWSFDELNRKKLPKNQKIPDLKNIKHNKNVIEAKKTIFQSNIEYLGTSEFFFYPTNFKEAKYWLNDFFENRFSLFGDYEDAITKNESFLWHSLLSPLLNTGLLTPKDVIDKALHYAEKNNIPLNSLEGFIRQIIGWREFICITYKKYGNKMRTRNFWNFPKKPIPEAFYNASTGIEPIDNVIKNILKYGYCHHIERLMILGNFMLLCRIHPDEVYKWFMEMFIDSYDWVMVPNVYGMSQFSDGGIFSTKPYISSSNYIRKMSDYKSDEWCVIWDALFWKFIHDYESYFRKQYRLAMLTRNLDKMESSKLNNHLAIGEDFLKNL